MDGGNKHDDAQVESAARMNESLARCLALWKRRRLAIAVVLTILGLAMLTQKAAAVFAVPCFLAALIAYLLYLDARDKLREVRSRHWTSPTPRISKIADAHRMRMPEAPTAQ